MTNTRWTLLRFPARVSSLLLLCGSTSLASAEGMVPLSDAALSNVQARDGFSFDLANFSVSGNAKLTYYAPGPSNASLYLSNPYFARSDDPDNPFSDPYRLDILPGAPGYGDFINIAFPANANGTVRWQTAFDWGVNADGIPFDGGSLILKDMAIFGGGVQWTTPLNGDGLAFGMGLRMEIGNILLRPRGRDDIAQADATTVKDQMNLSGLRLGAVDSNGAFLNQPWRIADVAAQPGIINAVTDADGKSSFHFGIGWPDANGAARGGFEINNLSFRTVDAAGNMSTVDLGSSRIGSMQIQYLDVKFKP